MGFKSFKVVTFDQILFDDGDSEGDGDGEFEGLKGGARMMSLLTLFGGLKNVFKVKTYSTDTVVFRLHYKVTMGFLMACCLLVTAIQLVTDPITCDVKGVSGGIFNAFCWTHATFTLPYRQFSKDGPILQPGVGPLRGGSEPQEEAVYHGFYQWVGIVLFGQSLTFYIPHFLWKSCEGKKVERLVSGIISPVATEEVKKKHRVAIADYFYCNKRKHTAYGLRFVICEILNLLNCSLQIYLIDQLLGGEFSTYGLQVLHFALLDDEERTDPMVKIFPKVTKCTFHNFGASGTIQQFDGLCILPINMINDKIYIALWFWLLLLLVISSFYMVFRVITIASPALRINYLKTISPSLSLKTCQHLKTTLGFGDWLILVMMSLHLDIKLFTDILNEINNVSFSSSRSISTAIDIISPSDTENEHEIFPKISYRKPSTLGLARSCTSTDMADTTGIEPHIVKEMLADGYDPTQMAQWQAFRQRTICDSEMLNARDKIDDWNAVDNGYCFDPRFNSNSPSQEDRDEAMEQHLLEMEMEDNERDDDKD